MAERLNTLRSLAIAGTLAVAGGGLGDVKPAIALEPSNQGDTPSGLVDPLRHESGKRFIDFNKGQSVLGDTVVIETPKGDQWKYNCYFPSAPRKGRVRYGVVDYSNADLRAAKERDARNCKNVTPRPGPRKETGDGSLVVGPRDFAYGYYFQDADDGEIRYNVSVNPGDHPEGRIYYGVRNQRPGETKDAGNFVNYDNANPRTGPRQETGAGGELSFGPGAEVYGWDVVFENGTDCNPADANGTRQFPGVKVINATEPGKVNSGVVDPPPAELDSQDFPVCNPQ